MKRLLSLFSATVMFILLATSTSTAQISLGGGLAYGSDYKEFALDLRGYYDLGKATKLMITPEFAYWFGTGEGVTFWNFDVNGQYTFISLPSDGRFYGLAGLDFAHASVDLGAFGSSSTTELGVNLGAGIEGNVGVHLFGELKFVVGNADQIVLTGGLRFPLGQ